MACRAPHLKAFIEPIGSPGVEAGEGHTIAAPFNFNLTHCSEQQGHSRGMGTTSPLLPFYASSPNQSH